jgi:two-component system LytT family sensor kinase
MGRILSQFKFSKKEWFFHAFSVVAYYLVFQTFYNLVAFKTLIPYDDARDMAISVTSNFIPIIILFVVNYLVVFCFFRRTRISLKMWFDALCSFALLFVLNGSYLFFVGLSRPVRLDWAGTIFNNLFILLGMEVAFYVKNFKDSVKKAELSHRKALQYKYDALKAQVNPHFLFNSLNILYSLVSTDQQKSKEFILALSQMYRYVMSQQNKDKIALKEELEFLHSYVSVLEMRYYNQFVMEIEGEDRVTDQKIIPYTLQLLVENVTKHNIISTRYPMKVSIVVCDDEIRISNPVKMKYSYSASHVGLNYLTELYKLHGKEFRVENDGKVFTAIIQYL